MQHAILLGLIVRLIVLTLLPDQGFPDAGSYENMGRELFKSGQTVNHTYMPLYPIWTYLVGGGLTLRLADIGLSIATIWLVWRLSLVVLGDRSAALLAAFALAIWPHAAFYAVSGLSETAYVFVLCLVFLCLYRQLWFWAITWLALSILIRPSLDPFAPLLVVLFASVIHRLGWRVTLRRLAQYAAIYLVVMTPWWIHQVSKYGTFVRLNLGDGVVLYAGNNPVNRSGGGVGFGPNERPGVNDIDASHPAYQIVDAIERNDALRKAAFDFISENPGRFATLAGLKFVRFWRLWPYAKEYTSPLIVTVSLLSYGVMLGAAIGFLIFCARGRWRYLSPVLALAGYLTLVHMITIGSIRYRYPLEPFVIILGCYALARLAERVPWIGRFLVQDTGNR